MQNWEVVLVYLVAGAFGGLVQLLVTGKGILVLPAIQETAEGSRFLNLGFLAPMLIGAMAGLVAPYTLGVNGVISVLSGYAGTDLLENMLERFLPRGKPDPQPAEDRINP